MMIMNQGSYRSIHKQPGPDTVSSNSRVFVHWAQRHAAKLIVSVALFILLFTSFLMIGTYASGTSSTALLPEEQIISVSSGDTLWHIAKRHSDGSQDIRYIVYKIKDRNNLQSVDIQPGQKLVIPNIH